MFAVRLANPESITCIADFDDYWSESGEGWSQGPDHLPPPVKTNLSDCHTGPSEIQIDCLQDMGLTEQEVLDINSGWRETTANAMRAVAKGGGWVWQMFSGVGGLSGTGDTCAKSLREQCKTQNNRMSMMGLSLKDSHTPGSLKDPKGDVAKFLLVRGDFTGLARTWIRLRTSFL